MQLFSYRAKNQQGKTVKGEVEALNSQQAAILLRKKQLTIISIKPIKKSALKKAVTLVRRISLSDIVLFTRQFSTMIAAGLPITDALRILEAQSRPAMAGVISEVHSDVEGGANLGDALERQSRVFSHIYISLVRAGESAGVLDDVLNRLADNLEKQKEFRGKVRGAMVYPTIIVIAMIIVSLIMVLFVIPKLMIMYENFGVELPLSTQVMLGVSNLLGKFWPVLLISVFGMIWVFRQWIKTPSGGEKFDRVLFRIPAFGTLRKQIILTEFTRTLGLLVGAGISIIDALKITSEAITSKIFRDGVLDAAKQVEKGLPLAVPIAQNPHFPPIMGQMINVGEETGKVDEVLTKVSQYFESESEQGVATLTAAIEPLIMVVLGIGVGILVISVIVPIYNLTGSL